MTLEVLDVGNDGAKHPCRPIPLHLLGHQRLDRAQDVDVLLAAVGRLALEIQSLDECRQVWLQTREYLADTKTLTLVAGERYTPLVDRAGTVRVAEEL